MIGAIVRCYKLNWMLPCVLRNLADVDIVLLAICKYTNDDVRDDTPEAVRRLNQENVHCVFYPPMPQKDLFNKCVEKLKKFGVKTILINDADEILLKKDRDYVIRKIEENQTDSAHVTVIDYVGMDCKKRYEIRTHKPVVVIKPSAVFDGNRSVGSGDLYNDIKLHHFGYAMDKEDFDWKYNNLWYGQHSFNGIINTKIEDANAPEELLMAVKDAK